ncbi:histidinol dehydrogenase [Vibrio lentus]|nr:histidinol dehydrogenase [Vibrio lentus]
MADFSSGMTVQELTADGLQGLAPTVVTMAEAEGLDTQTCSDHRVEN